MTIAQRQIFGSILMLLAVFLAYVFRVDGISKEELGVVLVVAILGGLIFDTNAALRFIRAFPWPWKRGDNGGDDGQ